MEKSIMSPEETQINPYIGPESFKLEDSERFKGRDIEGAELLSMILSERLVLFYAQSGAGKSSLINAFLVKALIQCNFSVLPIGRIGGQESQTTGGQNVNNIFVFNLLHNINDSPSVVTKISIAPEMTISQYLCLYNESDQSSKNSTQRLSIDLPQILIIDQFEELFITHQEAWKLREDFLKQIYQVMNDYPRLWVLLVIREDFIALVDPYTYIFPDQLRARFYMQRLGKNSAEKAIRNPASDIGWTYTQDAFNKIMNDLLKVSPESDIRGQFVDPIQLQVFCYQLWEKVKGGGDKVIVENDVKEFGDVKEALGNYYTRVVKEAAQVTCVGELKLRQWIAGNLIHSNNRDFVELDIVDKIGIPKATLDKLEEKKLIHRVSRVNRIGYELIHDRLVSAVIDKNKEWMKDGNRTRFQKFQMKSKEWVDQNDKELLLKGKDLKEFKKWKESSNPTELLGTEAPFIEECLRHESSNRLKTIIGILAAVIIVSLFITTGIIWNQRQINKQNIFNMATQDANMSTQDANLIIQVTSNAKKNYLSNTQSVQLTKEKRINETQSIVNTESVMIARNAITAQAVAEANSQSALSRQLAYQGKSALENEVDLGILLSLASYQIDPSIWDSRSALLSSLMTGLDQNVEPYELMIPSMLEHVNALDISPDGKTIAWSGSQGIIVFWDVEAKTTRILQDTNKVLINSQAFSPVDHNLFVTGNYSSEILFWDLKTGEFQRVLDPGNRHNDIGYRLGKVRKITFSGDGKYIAVNGDNLFIEIWDVYNRSLLRSFYGFSSYYWDLDWSPNNKFLAAAGVDNKLYIFDPIGGRIIDTQRNPSGNAPIYNVKWSPDGKVLAFGGVVKDSQARVYFYDIAQKDVHEEYLEYNGLTIHSLAYNEPEGYFIAAAGLNQPVNLWKIKDQAAIANFSKYGSYQFGFSFVRDLMAFIGENSINVYKMNVQEPLSKHMSSFAGVPLDIRAGEDNNIWIVSKSEDDLLIQNPKKEEPFRLGKDLVGKVLLANLYFSKAEPHLITYDGQGLIKQWDLSLLQSKTLELGDLLKNITAMAVNRHGDRLAISYCEGSSSDQTIEQCSAKILVWDLVNGKVMGRPILMSENEIQNLEFDWNNSLLISSSRDGKISLIDLSSGEPSLLLFNARSFAISPDGATLAVGQDDGKIILWDLKTGQNIGSPVNNHISIVKIAYSPDGKTLYAAYSNGQLFEINVDFNDWFNRLCNIVGRDMTQEEWNLFVRNEPFRPICSSFLSNTTTPTPKP